MSDSLPELFRYPRSPVESSAYNPNWRALQANQYVGAYRARLAEEGEDNVQFALPAWESDADVINLYAYLRFGTVGNDRDDARYFYAVDANYNRATTGATSRIKGMVIAGFSVDEIAEEMCTVAINIWTYLRLYFDLDGWLDNDGLISRIVFPHTTPPREDIVDRKDRMVMAVARMLPKEQFRHFLYKTVDMTAGAEELLSRKIRTMGSSQALDYMIGRRAAALPSSQDFLNYLELVKIEQVNNNPEANKRADAYQSGLSEIIKRNSGFSPDGLKVEEMSKRVAKVAPEDIESSLKELGDTFDTALFPDEKSGGSGRNRINFKDI